MTRSAIALAVAAVFMAVPVKAQIPTTDIATQMNLLQQLMQLKEQYDQLVQIYNGIQSAANAVTGNRGFGALVSGFGNARMENYLPRQYEDASDARRLGAQFGSILRGIETSRQVVGALKRENFRTPEDYARWVRLVDQMARQRGIQAKIYDQGAVHADRVQILADRIATTNDSKAIQELHASMTAAGLMLQVETNRMLALQNLQEQEHRTAVQQEWDRFSLGGEVPKVNYPKGNYR